MHAVHPPFGSSSAGSSSGVLQQAAGEDAVTGAQEFRSVGREAGEKQNGLTARWQHPVQKSELRGSTA